MGHLPQRCVFRWSSKRETCYCLFLPAYFEEQGLSSVSNRFCKLNSLFKGISLLNIMFLFYFFIHFTLVSVNVFLKCWRHRFRALCSGTPESSWWWVCPPSPGGTDIFLNMWCYCRYKNGSYGFNGKQKVILPRPLCACGMWMKPADRQPAQGGWELPGIDRSGVEWINARQAGCLSWAARMRAVLVSLCRNLFSVRSAQKLSIGTSLASHVAKTQFIQVNICVKLLFLFKWKSWMWQHKIKEI